MKKYISECIGTFILVFIGCASAAFFGGSTFGVLAIALAFGLSIVMVYYTVGQVSGGHVNPAVSLAMVFDGRMEFGELIGYVISQFIGAIAGSALLHLVINQIPNTSDLGLGQNGFGDASTVNINVFGALLIEIILTCLFVFVILKVSDTPDFKRIGGIVIGFTLTAVHLIGLPLTGTSVNPIRSLAPALVLFLTGQSTALSQVWVFIVGPLIGAILADILYKFIQE